MGNEMKVVFFLLETFQYPLCRKMFQCAFLERAIVTLSSNSKKSKSRASNMDLPVGLVQGIGSR